jgi:hypothetical protein
MRPFRESRIMKLKTKYFSLLVGAGFAALLYDPFPTLAAIAPDLGQAKSFALLSARVTNTGPPSSPEILAALARPLALPFPLLRGRGKWLERHTSAMRCGLRLGMMPSLRTLISQVRRAILRSRQTWVE